jgi:hypothetical protein
MLRGSCASSALLNFAARSARLTVSSSSTRARSITVRSLGVTGMPLKIVRSMSELRCALIRGCECFVGAVISNGRPSHFTSARSAAAE